MLPRLSRLGATLPLVVATVAGAQTPIPPDPVPEWERLAPLAGAGPLLYAVTETAADPDRLYANSSAGLLVSHDRGLSWEVRRRRGPLYTFFARVDVSPADPDHLMAADLAEGLIRSTDGGRTWSYPTLAPDPASTLDIEFAGPDRVWASMANGIWRSDDGGDTFTQVAFEFTGKLAVDASDPDHVYSYAGGGVLETSDAGATWTTKPYPSGASWGNDIAVDPADPQRVLLADEDVWLSTDGGDTWVQATFGATTWVTALEFDPLDPGRAYAGRQLGGLAVSTDGGATWTQVTSGLDTSGGTFYELLPSRTHAGLVLAATPGGVFRSVDHGASFERRNDGLEENALVYALAANTSDPDHLVAKTGGSAFVSHDGGLSWTESTGFHSFFASTIAADPFGPSFVVGVDDGRTWRSDDGGHTFYEASVTAGAYFQEIVAHPSVPDRLFASGRGVLRSDDGGLSWTQIAPFSWSLGLALSPVDPDVMHCSAATTIWSTVDGGSTWTKAGSVSGPAYRIVADPLDVQRAYGVGIGVGGQRTEDGGSTWTPLDPDLLYCTSIDIPADDPGTVVFGDLGEPQAFFSRDGGDTALRFPRGVPSQIIDFEPTTNGVFAGTWGGGVLVWR